MSDIVIPDEAVEALARVVAMQQSGDMWEHYTAATRQLLIVNYKPTAHTALVAALPAIRRQILTEAIEGIRAEDWWTPEGGSEYDIGDNDGKVRVIAWLDDRIAEIDGAE